MRRRGLLNRRAVLQLCGGSAVLASWFQSAIGRAQGQPAPKRLVIVLRPNGTIGEDWLRGAELGPILEPFRGVWDRAVALKGVNVRPSQLINSHEAGLLTIMTGGQLGEVFRTSDDFRSTRGSLDQKLLELSPALQGTTIPSLQLGAHGDQDGGNETPNCTLSYSAADTPLYPNLDPNEVYTRLFADLLPPGMDDAALQQRRARRQSVLDFLTRDLTRVRGQFPASFKEDLDLHEAAIRELETSLDGADPQGLACTKPSALEELAPGGDFKNVERVGNAHLQLITAALACDLTRVVTFMWTTGASLVKFGDFGADNYHSTSHANVRPTLSKCDQWFSERTAPFIQSLIDHDDVGGGKLIDNTLVWYISEVSEGWNHSFEDYPFVFFGGDGVGLKSRGRILDVSGQGHTSNDIWSALAPSFGATLSDFATETKAPIPGLFTL